MMGVEDRAQHVSFRERIRDPMIEKIRFFEEAFEVQEKKETHTAFVFLTPDRALKIKKPIQLEFLDHRSLEAREHACREEIRLNRQLSDDVYLEVEPLVRSPRGTLGLGGFGTVVDWVIKMRRLPSNRMLDVMLRSRRKPLKTDIQAVADRLVSFYRERQTEPPRTGVYLAHLLKESAINTDHLIAMRTHFKNLDVADITARAQSLLAIHTPEIEQRDQSRQIIEGHGDLRPEHICLTEPPVIFDRIEFSDDMRMIDVFDEVNYLGLECTILRAPWIGKQVMQTLKDAGFAPPSADLMRAYGVFRSVTRARLSIDHLLHPSPRTPRKWPAQARTYLTRAAELLDEDNQP